MQKIMSLIMMTGFMMLLGCQQQKPVDVARDFMNRQISAHQGFELDTSQVTYKLVEESGESAKVAVSGEIRIKGEVVLKKVGTQWKIADRETLPEKQAEPVTNH